MTKVFIARIGYQDYAVPMEDGPYLLAALAKLQPVTRKSGYSGPYIPEDADPPLRSIELGDLVEPDPPVVEPAPAPPSEPLAIGHTRKIGHDADLPF